MTQLHKRLHLSNWKIPTGRAIDTHIFSKDEQTKWLNDNFNGEGGLLHVLGGSSNPDHAAIAAWNAVCKPEHPVYQKAKASFEYARMN